MNAFDRKAQSLTDNKAEQSELYYLACQIEALHRASRYTYEGKEHTLETIHGNISYAFSRCDKLGISFRAQNEMMYFARAPYIGQVQA